MLRILLMDQMQQYEGSLLRALTQAGHAVVAEVAKAHDLKKHAFALLPDVLIINSSSPDHITLEQLSSIQQNCPCPVVMFSYDGSNEKIQDAVRAGVTSYVVNGFSVWRLNAIIHIAIARFNETQALRQELAEIHKQLDGSGSRGAVLELRSAARGPG